MRLLARDGSELWLTYGMNVHPGGSLRTTREAIERTVLPLRDRLGVRGPFGLGLRLDARGVAQASADGETDRLHALLASQRLVPFTGNAFVLGTFHGESLKERVYAPAWTEDARVTYTVDFAVLLAAASGWQANRVSLSTAPGSWRAWGQGPEVDRACASRIAETAALLCDLIDAVGVDVRLGLEPEPGCTLQTTDEAIRFFRGPLAEAFAGHPAAARRHVGLCYDVCHQAVVDEDPDATLDALLAAGVPIVKVQASCALEVPDPADPASREALEAFAEPVYLHQVGARDAAGALHVAPDLPVALADDAWRARAPWRVHYHVPVFRREAVPPLRTTRPFLDRVLARVAAGGVTDHLEIETYTWDVLPEAERRAGSGFDLVDALEKEYRSVLEVLEAHGVRRHDAASGEEA